MIAPSSDDETARTDLAAVPDGSASPAVADFGAGERLHPLLSIPDAELAAYRALSPAAYRDLNEMRSIVSAFMAAKHGERNKLLEEMAAARNWPPKRISYRIEQFNRARRDGRPCAWAYLLDRKKHRMASDGTQAGGMAVPQPFAEFVVELAQRHQRNNAGRQVLRELVAQWEAWRQAPLDKSLALPGYDSPPEACPRNRYRPAGWSERTIQRIIRGANKYGVRARRRGRKDASALAFKVKTTRVGMQPGAVYEFDDSWHDTWINLLGTNMVRRRPMAFYALERLSGCVVEMGLKPQVCKVNANGRPGRMELRERDFFWFVMHVLTKHGYNAQTGTTMIWEHGTANLSQTEWCDRRKVRVNWFEQALERETGGRVTVSRSGTYGDPLLAGLRHGDSGGNFRRKPALEGIFNLIRNYSAGLPAPTGRNRDEAPGEDYGLEIANQKIVELATQLPPRMACKLMGEALEWSVYAPVAYALLEAVNRREDHKSEGWAACQFTGRRIVADNGAMIEEESLGEMSDTMRAAVLAMAKNEGREFVYNKSPREIYETRVAPALTKLPEWKIPHLAHPRFWREVRVSDEADISFVDREVNPDGRPLRFPSVFKSGRIDKALPRGETFMALLNPHQPDKLWLAEPGRRAGEVGAVLGASPRIDSAPCGEWSDALARQLGTAKHVAGVDTSRLRLQSQSEIQRRLEIAENNRRASRGALLDDDAERAAGDSRDRAAGLSDADVAAALNGDGQAGEEPPPALPAPSGGDVGADDFEAVLGD